MITEQHMDVLQIANTLNTDGNVMIQALQYVHQNAETALKSQAE